MKLLQGDEREQALRHAGVAAGKFWETSEQEGYQGCREFNDALRNVGGPDQGIDGDPIDWIVGAGCRVKGVSPAERDAIATDTVRLRRGSTASQ